MQMIVYSIVSNASEAAAFLSIQIYFQIFQTKRITLKVIFCSLLFAIFLPSISDIRLLFAFVFVFAYVLL